MGSSLSVGENQREWTAAEIELHINVLNIAMLFEAAYQ